ncbi:MAG: CDP-glucose 4,6-dehydratase [Lachnospiraceae bacterium]
MINQMINQEFWRGKKVLITGHTGFKGSWLSIWLCELGAEVIGYGLDPYTEKDNFVLSNVGARIIDIRGDIRDRAALQEVFNQYQPEIVFHMAAQPLVRLSYEEPYVTYETNVMGTLNVLECVRSAHSTKVGIMITTDKCYENKEQIWGYRESDPFGGYDPYSASKACAEILIASYRNSFLNLEQYQTHGTAIASVRAGNVIGGGDWSKDRIIPDCIRALEAKEPIKIRNPKSIRPWQHVLEPLYGYLMLGEKLYENPLEYSGGWNFGPEDKSFITVWNMAEKIIKYYGTGSLVETVSAQAPHEANLLFLDITKAKQKLGWYPRLSVEKAIQLTVQWYLQYSTKDTYSICQQQIQDFLSNLSKVSSQITDK